MLVVLLCKHEFDARYQKSEDKLYIAQLYFPLIGQVPSLFLCCFEGIKLEDSSCLLFFCQYSFMCW